MKMKKITIWKRLNLETDLMEHNHIEDGHVPLNLKVPIGKFINQTKSWSSRIWEKEIAYLDKNNKIMRI